MSSTKAQFRERHNMSRSREFELEAQELGPRTYHNGSRVMVSPQAEQEWILMMEVLDQICALPEGEEHNVRSACQMAFEDLVPDVVWRRAWKAAPAERARRSKRAVSRRVAIQKRQARQAEASA